MYLLDTDVLIDVQRGYPPAVQWISALSEAPGLGLLDSLIAACALSRSAVLCTLNKKHFKVIPGLRIEQPYEK